MKSSSFSYLVCVFCFMVLMSSCIPQEPQQDYWLAQESAKMFRKLTDDNDNIHVPVDLKNNYFCFNNNETKLFFLKAQSSTQTNIFSKSVGTSSLSQQLTFVDKRVFDPAVSPDNKYLMYSDRRDKGWAIVSQEIGSSNIKYLQNTKRNAFSPTFFTNKKMILFSEIGDDNEVWIYQQDWNNESLINQITRGFSACFFPNGKKFVFVRLNTSSKQYELLMWDFTTSQETILKSDPGTSFFQPSVSKDGKYIAYTQWQQVGRTPGNFNIFIVDANGNNTTQVTFNPSNDVNPVWSKVDATKLYILSKRSSDNFNVWSLKAY